MGRLKDSGTFPGSFLGPLFFTGRGGVPWGRLGAVDSWLLPALALRKGLILLDGGEAGARLCLLDRAEVQVLAWEFRPTVGASRRLGSHL